MRKDLKEVVQPSQKTTAHRLLRTHQLEIAGSRRPSWLTTLLTSRTSRKTKTITLPRNLSQQTTSFRRHQVAPQTHRHPGLSQKVRRRGGLVQEGVSPPTPALDQLFQAPLQTLRHSERQGHHPTHPSQRRRNKTTSSTFQRRSTTHLQQLHLR